MLTKVTAFEQGLVYIPTHKTNSLVGNAIVKDIETHIELIEPKMVKHIFTDSFYEKLKEEMEKTVIDPLYKAVNDRLVDSLKYFIYIEYDKFRQTLQTETGTKGTSDGNLEARNAFQNHRKLYNYGVHKMLELYDFMTENSSDYPDYTDIGLQIKTINSFNI